MKYSIWRKDIFVQESEDEDITENNIKEDNVVLDFKIKKHLLKNSRISDKEKDIIKTNHALSLLKWNETREEEFEKQRKKDSQTLHSYMCQLKREKEMEKIKAMESHANNMANVSYPNEIKNKSLSSMNALYTSSNPLLSSININKSVSTLSKKFYSNSNLMSSSSYGINGSHRDINPRYEMAKLNSLMRRIKSENKINYVRDYCTRKKKLEKKDDYPKDIFNDNQSVMDNIKNFTIDQFINEYKSYIKSRETMWNRENNEIKRKSSQDTKNHLMTLDIIKDLLNETVNSHEPYIRCKYKSNYSGDSTPEYITFIMNLLTKKNGIWSDKELIQIRGFLCNLKSFKEFTKDFINNVIYNSKTIYYDKNTILDISK